MAKRRNSALIVVVAGVIIVLCDGIGIIIYNDIDHAGEQKHK